MNLDNTIVVVADLGQLKVYRVVSKLGIDRHKEAKVSTSNASGEEKLSVNFELIKDIDDMSEHKRISEEMSDNIGLTGEPHNMLLEKDKKGLKHIADDIKTVIVQENPSAWFLSFPNETINQLISMLDHDVKKLLTKSIPSDLTKVNKSKLQTYFL